MDNSVTTFSTVIKCIIQSKYTRGLFLFYNENIFSKKKFIFSKNSVNKLVCFNNLLN